MSVEPQVKLEPCLEYRAGSGARAGVIELRKNQVCMKKEPDLPPDTSRLVVEHHDELYADHVVKDELVLGPERPHRPNVGLTVRSKPPPPTARLQQPTPFPLRECSVQLERMNLTAPNSKTHNTSVAKLPTNSQCQTSEQNENADKNEGKNYVCDTCGRAFKFRHTIIQHFRYHLPDVEYLQKQSLPKSHTSEKTNYCAICKKNLSCLGSLKRHIKTHFCKKKHMCFVCGKKFSQAGDFKRHMLLHSKDKPMFPCDVCKKLYTSWSVLKVHKRTHLGLKLFACDLCDKRYGAFHALKIHKLTHREEEKPYICDICDQRFRSIDRLRLHKRIHMEQKPYSCDNCRKGFVNSYQLDRHKLLHLKKPHTCKTCKKIFETSSELAEHIRGNKKPYSCQICKKVFCEFKYFKKHKYRMHGGEEKTFFCQLCRLDFKTVTELNDHKQTHMGYSCGVCHKKFTDNRSLQKHKKTHNKTMSG